MDAVQFSDSEFLHFALVRGKDEKFRFDLYQNIKKLEEYVNRQNIRKNAVVGATNFNNKICILCCAQFSWFYRCSKCKICGHFVCRSCLKKETTICILCHNIRQLEKQRKRWNFLFPYSRNSFIAFKLSVPPSDMNFSDIDDEAELNEEKLFAWITRNIIELKINELCKINIDESPIDKEAADTTLRELGVCLETVVNEYLAKCKFANDEKLYFQLFKMIYERQIADICYDIQTTINQVIQSGRKPVLNSTNFNDRRNYANLLATAVVNKLILESACLQQFDTVSNISFKVSNRDYYSPFRQRFSFDYDMDSALGVDDRSSLASGIFSKDSIKRCPLRLHPTVRSVKHFFVSLPIDESSVGDNHSFEEDSGSHSTPIKSPSRHFLVKLADVHCDSGQKATFHCRVSSISQVDVYWYLNNKEINDKGRYRLFEQGDDHYLEIYDVCPADSGEVVCLAVDDANVESESCFLKVEDCDVAGEDPYFEKPLENQVALIGNEACLQLNACGYPEPRVTFYHNRAVIYNDERRFIENNFGHWTLTIKKLLPIDSGEYLAVATNRMGRVCCKANLHIIFRDCSDDRFHSYIPKPNLSNEDDPNNVMKLSLAPKRKYSSSSC